MKEIIRKADEIKDIYINELFEDLEGLTNSIYKNLRKELELLCKEADLVTSNSVYQEIYPFSLIFRVKKPESLKEKIIRKSLYDEIYDQDSTYVTVNILDKVNDLIGITILIDTSKNLEIFANFLFSDKIKGIRTITTHDQSKKEFGDLLYYNVKVIYDKSGIKIPIEIQIKSTIVSAFTNIQHKLIYKNRDVYIMKENNDLMLKSITPSVITIEKVIDSVEQSFLDSEIAVEAYERQKRIQKLIYEKSGDDPIFDVFIKDIDKIIGRSVKGEIIKCKKEKLKDFEIETNFWDKLSEEKKMVALNSGDKSFLLKILLSIGYIDEDFILNTVYFDYFAKKGSNEDNYTDKKFLDEIDRIWKLIQYLNKEKIDIYDQLLLDVKYKVVNDIENCISIVSEFLEEEQSIEKAEENEIINAAIIFLFNDEKNMSIQNEISLIQNIGDLEESIRSEKEKRGGDK